MAYSFPSAPTEGACDFELTRKGTPPFSRPRSTAFGNNSRNAKGNLVAKLSGVWATVYRDDQGYRFVRKHVFSHEKYATEREACEAACRSA